MLFDLKGKRQYKRIFWIYSLFAKSNSIKRFKDIEAVARDKYDCHVVRFQTLRNDKAWERSYGFETVRTIHYMRYKL